MTKALTPSVTLYGYATSPYVRKTGCFLYYKGIDFDFVPVNPADPQIVRDLTERTQVPVLEIDGEWRVESSSHAHWLDTVFPEKPLCPPDYADKIQEIDRWISETFLTSIFRGVIDGDLDLQFRFRGWRLAALLSAHTPLPEHIRHKWPDVLKTAPFIQDMAKHMDLTESYADMQARIAGELVQHLGDGPYLGELDAPSMLDMAVFPQLVFGYMFGLDDKLRAAQHPALRAWMRRVAEHLPSNPTLLADFMQVRSLSEGLDTNI